MSTWIRVILRRSPAVEAFADDYCLDIQHEPEPSGLVVVEGEYGEDDELADVGPFLARYNDDDDAWLSAGLGPGTPIVSVSAIGDAPALRLYADGPCQNDVKRALAYFEVARQVEKLLGLCAPDAPPHPVVGWLRGLLEKDEVLEHPGGC